MQPAAGIGFKPEYFDEAASSTAAGLWFEVHAENYMVEGGPRLAMLEAIRRDRPLSLHGVGMSLAGAAPPDADHLAGLKRLVERFRARARLRTSRLVAARRPLFPRFAARPADQ